MKIKLKNKTLLEILSRVKGFIPSRPVFPYQSMVLISPINEGCYFYTQGPEAQVRCYSEGIFIEKPAQKLISVSRIFDISRNFPEDSDILLSFESESVQVSCEEGKYKLNTLPPSNFPLMSDPDKNGTVKLPERELKYLLEKTDFCMASQDPRHYLNGLLFSLKDNKISTVSTDSHRLALSSLPISSVVETEGILPRDIVAELKRLSSDTKDSAEINISSKNIFISLKNIQISAKALNGQFPDYKKVLPKDFLVEIVLEREVFLSSLLRASAILASPSEEGLHINLVFSEKELLIKSRNHEGEEASVKQTSEYMGKTFEIAFNSRYLQDVMKTLDTAKVCLQIRDASSGVRIIGHGSTTEEYVVMPLRL